MGRLLGCKMIPNLSRYANRIAVDGDIHYSPVMKTSLPNVGAFGWADLSMGAEIPRFNAYVGSQATATPMIGQRNDSIYAGEFAAGRTKYLHKMMFHNVNANGAPNYLLLCDYVMSYPLIDLDSTEVQEMDNTLLLPRYTDGVGLSLFAVVTTPMATNADCIINYTDSSGNAQSITRSLVASTVTGGLCSTSGLSQVASARSPFIPTPNGIRRLNSVQLLSSAGGFAAFVICKPLCGLQIFETGVPAEIQYIKQMSQAPKIQSGAFLNFLNLQGSTNPPLPLQGLVEFINI